MKIAIISDTHDNKANLALALKAIQEKGATTLLFCGDFCAPFMLKEMASQFSGDIHVVFGNNDGDQFSMTSIAQDLPNMILHGEYAALNLGGKRIGMTHYPFYAEAMAKSGDYDLVCFGHDHEARVLTFGAGLAVNPGCLYEKPAAFAIYDTTAHAATLFKLDVDLL